MALLNTKAGNRLLLLLALAIGWTKHAQPQQLQAVKHIRPDTLIRWEVAAKLPDAGGQPTAKGLAGAICGVYEDYLIVAGGSNFPDRMPWDGGTKRYYDCVFIYRIKEQTGRLSLKKILRLPVPVAYSAVCTTPFGVFTGGGENEKGALSECRMLGYDSTKRILIVQNLPPLPKAITNAAAAWVNGRIFIAGGESSGITSGSVYSYSPFSGKPAWTREGVLPRPASHLLLANAGDLLFTAGGRARNEAAPSAFFNTTWFYNSRNKSWHPGGLLPKAISAACGVSLGQVVYIISGDGGETFNQVERAMLQEATCKNELKAHYAAERVNLQKNHPGFFNSIYRYDNMAQLCQLYSGYLPQAPVTANACLYKGRYIYVAGGEVRAGVRTPNILLGKFNGK